MKQNLKIGLIALISMIGIINSSIAQNFSGEDAFIRIMEYEGQRFLMAEVFNVDSINYDTLRIEKNVIDIDGNEGFKIVITIYKFKGQSGVVITSFNSVSIDNKTHEFRNVHLSHNEYLKLNEMFIQLEKARPIGDQHLLKMFNNRLTCELIYDTGAFYYLLWVDNQNRHTFTTSKWNKAMQSYMKFIEKPY